MRTPIVGQVPIIDYIYSCGNNLPHFIVLIGAKGSGKRTLAYTIAHIQGCVYSEVDTKVDTVRSVIESAYTSATKVLYCFADADTMRAEAKNAMLKITEEPPENAYFVLTVQDDSTLLDTIKSRADVIRMFPYTRDELKLYIEDQGVLVNYSDVEKLTYICNTPGDIDILMSYNIQEFYDYVKLVYDNIATVEPANAFKSSSKLAIKDDEGYDLRLFWLMFVYIACEDLMHNGKPNGAGVLVTTQYLNKLQKVGINKQQLYDSWVFDIREAWL
jgi:hypothetical protein